MTETFTETCTTPEKQAAGPPRPELSGTLDEGGIEGNTTGPNLTENRLPAGGVFKT